MPSDICQSCALPFDGGHRHFRACEKDGSPSKFCTFCYRDGAFTDPNATVQVMIETGVPHLGRKIGEAAARERLGKLVPTLDRWRDP